MKLFSFLFATLLVISASVTQADVTVMDTPMAGTTMYLTQRQISTYYTVDGDHYSVVVVFPTGSDSNPQPVKQTIQLSEGQTFNISIGGYGNDRTTSTLKMTRNNSQIIAEVL